MSAKIYRSHFLCRLSLLVGLVSVGIALLAVLVLAAAPARAAQPLQGGATCFATLNDGAYVYSSTTAQAVRDAVGAATDGGLIKFAGYCPGALAQDGTTQTVLITKSLSLVGGYTVTDWAQYNPISHPTTLDAQGGGRVINASAAASVTLQGFTVANGYVSSTLKLYGGGIFAAGALTLTDMVVYSNTITSTSATGSHSGGGVYVAGPALVISTTISDNTAKDGGGGAVFVTTATVINTLFSGNTTNNYGGGAYFAYTATVSNTIFSNNMTDNHGGGAYFASTASVANTTFKGNVVNRSGGGGAVFNHTASVTNTSFINNHASGGGGAWFKSTTSVTSSTFSGNSANEEGGGALFSGFPGVSYVTDTTFFSNVASSYGGGAVFGRASVTNSRFISNTLNSSNRSNTRGASAGGGGAYFYLSAEVTGSTFSNNIVNIVDGWDVFGGGAYFDAPASVTGSTFSGNAISGDNHVSGGGAHFEGRTSVRSTTFTDNVISGNMNISGGGAAFQGPASVTNALFRGNAINGSISAGGGGAYFSHPTDITDTAFVNNRVSSDNSAIGGGAWFVINTNLSMLRATFNGNSANHGGGALFSFYAPGIATLTNMTFTNNTALNSGGGMYFHNADATQVVNVLLARNWAGSQGAAIYVSTANALRFIHSTIVSPTAPTGALQAVYVQTGTVYLTNTLIASHTVGLGVAGGTVREWHGLYAGVATPYTGNVSVSGSLTGTAGFVNPALDDYHILTTSAALNAGTTPNPNVTLDIDGHPRPQGAGYDIGYDEYWLLFWQYLPFVSK